MAEVDIRLQPRAGSNAIGGERGGKLLVRVTAPPVDGRANAALCRLIAKAAGVAPGKVTVVRGESARDKVVSVEGIGEDALRSALGL